MLRERNYGKTNFLSSSLLFGQVSIERPEVLEVKI